MLERYMKLSEIKGDPDKLLFRGLSSTKHGYRLRDSGGLSYTRARELVLEKLKAIGLDARQFGMHSLRSGEHQPQLMQVYQTGCSRDMVDGCQRLLKTVISKISLMIDFLCPRI